MFCDGPLMFLWCMCVRCVLMYVYVYIQSPSSSMALVNPIQPPRSAPYGTLESFGNMQCMEMGFFRPLCYIRQLYVYLYWAYKDSRVY